MKEKNLLKSIAAVLLVFVIYKVFAVFAPLEGMSYALQLVVKEAVFLSASLVAAGVLGKLNLLKFKTEGFKAGLAAGASMVVGIILITTGAVVSGHVVPNMDLVLLLVGTLMIGINEELMYRGILQNAFHEYFGEKSVANVRKALLFSCLVFGPCHLANVLTGASILTAGPQAIIAICTGMILGVVYYRSKRNLWVSILIHAFWDCSLMLGLGSAVGTAASNIASFGAPLIPALVLMVIVAVVLETVLVLFLTRKKKIEPLLTK